MLDAILGGVGKVGDWLTGVQNRRASEAFSREQQANNIALQREFAQQGIQWKVEDAKKAGIHPLYALGAQTHSFSPVSISSPDSPATSFGSMGQDLGRALMASQSKGDRAAETIKALSVERAGLENELLKSQIARMRSGQLGPGLPGGRTKLAGQGDTEVLPPPEKDIPEEKPSERKQLKIGGVYLPADPQTSVGQDWEDVLGDEGIPAYILKNIAQLFHVWHGGSTALNSWASRQSAAAEGRYKRYTGSRFVPKRFRD